MPINTRPSHTDASSTLQIALCRGLLGRRTSQFDTLLLLTVDRPDHLLLCRCAQSCCMYTAWHLQTMIQIVTMPHVQLLHNYKATSLQMCMKQILHLLTASMQAKYELADGLSNWSLLFSMLLPMLLVLILLKRQHNLGCVIRLKECALSMRLKANTATVMLCQ